MFVGRPERPRASLHAYSFDDAARYSCEQEYFSEPV